MMKSIFTNLALSNNMANPSLQGTLRLLAARPELERYQTSVYDHFRDVPSRKPLGRSGRLPACDKLL
jgi:hypothetical protein